MERVGRSFGFPTSLNIHPLHFECQDKNVEMRAMQIRGGGSLPSEQTGAYRGMRLKADFVHAEAVHDFLNRRPKNGMLRSTTTAFA
ncbi:hypothetical protein AVEN_30331-1 [Araneus ventricosus]|uniref:Uncharacterized protein n=1 Tax=Araneus ventricosus TaxID=182803 RepID=A0A4Y2MKK3_ARAVE|nr:hypothetical protein AVEN_30331-1 [Araneus ventricosus]